MIYYLENKMYYFLISKNPAKVRTRGNAKTIITQNNLDLSISGIC
jgi:hypothetical protein